MKRQERIGERNGDSKMEGMGERITKTMQKRIREEKKLGKGG